MIKLKADGADLVSVIFALAQAVRGEAPSVSAPVPAPGTHRAPLPPTPPSAESLPPAEMAPPRPLLTEAESFWNEPIPTSEPVKPDTRAARVQAGGVVFYHLVSTWGQNFGTEGVQPDRVKCLNDALTDESLEIFAFVQNAGGLTQAVSAVAPSMEARKRRLIAENIASVSSAMGVSGLADMLEYKKEYRNMGVSK